METPWDRQREDEERAGKVPEGWGCWHHRHFASAAVHRDGGITRDSQLVQPGSECDQPGTPRRVYVFDPDALSEHELFVARYAIAHPEEFGEQAASLKAAVTVLDGTSRKPFGFSSGHWLGVKDTLRAVAAAIREEESGGEDTS